MRVIAKTEWTTDTTGGVWVYCPGCRLFAMLDHTADEHGAVRPSLDCPECDFHESVRLGDWSRKP